MNNFGKAPIKGEGMAVDRAFSFGRGRPDVVVAVVSAAPAPLAPELERRWALNTGELVGTWGGWWCALRMRGCARLVWGIFFASVAMVFAGSAYYHAAPDDDQLVWDRLPTTLAFTGLVGAVVT